MNGLDRNARLLLAAGEHCNACPFRPMATNAELAAVLGLSRAESVPNLTRRFGHVLAIDAKTRNWQFWRQGCEGPDDPKYLILRLTPTKAPNREVFAMMGIDNDNRELAVRTGGKELYARW